MVIFFVGYPILMSFAREITAHDDWTLVFKAATGGNVNVYDLYTGSTTLNVNNAAAQSLSSPIAEHFKSDVINNWSTAGISQVRMSVHKGGAEVAFFLFNGTGSDNMNWISKERLLNSSYTDLNANSITNVFSIEGHLTDFGLQRRFCINNAWGFCTGAIGWLMIMDTESVKYCDWEKIYQLTPSIVYSPLSTKATYQHDMSKQESTTQAETSPNLESTSMVSIVQSQPQSTVVSGIYETVSAVDFSCSDTCSEPNVTMYCCACEDHVVQTKTTSFTIDEKIQKLKTELTVNKKNTTMYRRSLTSVYETRLSAVTMGSVGIAIIVSVIALFAVCDCMKIAQFQDESKMTEV